MRLALCRFLAFLLIWFVRAVRCTWRVRLVGEPSSSARLLAFWHGDQLCLAARRQWGASRPAVLISRSRDGEIAARVARGLGLDVVRGSSSRGAASGALALARRLKRGGVAALAADGPRGPRHRATESAARLARVAGTQFAPVAAVASSGVRVGSWDRMLIPWPFAKIVVVIGMPRTAGVEDALAEARAHAEQLAARGGTWRVHA